MSGAARPGGVSGLTRFVHSFSLSGPEGPGAAGRESNPHPSCYDSDTHCATAPPRCPCLAHFTLFRLDGFPFRSGPCRVTAGTIYLSGVSVSVRSRLGSCPCSHRGSAWLGTADQSANRAEPSHAALACLAQPSLREQPARVAGSGRAS